MRVRTPPPRSRVRLADAAAACAVFAWAASIAARAVRLQWDFRVYLDAARAALSGLDPYRLESLAAVSSRPATLPFLYPPIALVPFIALSALPEPVALALWMSLKLALLAGLVILWKRAFTPRAPWSMLALIAVFGSNAAALWDLRSGNVALVEAALIWGALACWASGRVRAFAALIVAAALLKLAPAAFLLLLLAPVGERRARPALFLGALAALLGIVAASSHLGPAAHWTMFAHVGHGPFPTGESNPAVFSFLVERAHGLSARAWIGWGAWLVLLALAVARPLVRIARGGDATAVALAAVTLYVLAHPRPMAYGWVLAGGALAWLIPGAAPGAAARAGLTAIACAQGILWAFRVPWTGPVAGYAPVIVLAALAGLAAASGNLQPGAPEAAGGARATGAQPGASAGR